VYVNREASIGFTAVFPLTIATGTQGARHPEVRLISLSVAAQLQLYRGTVDYCWVM